MIGSIDTSDKSVTIIGGGISGLFAAYYLLKRNYQVSVFEAQSRLGGLVQTSVAPEGLVERAAHSFRSSAAILGLCEDLGIKLNAAQTKRKYIYRHGRMSRFPLRFGETVELFKRALSYKSEGVQLTMKDWSDRHLGSAVTEAMITPLMRGIYACAPQDALQDLVFPALTVPRDQTFICYFLSRERASQKKPVMMAPSLGMGALVDALGHYIKSHPQGKVFTNTQTAILPDVKNIILATSARHAATLLSSSSPETSKALAAISYAPLVTVTVFVKNTGYHFPNGVGVLSAANEKLRALGVLFNSSGLAGRAYDSTISSFSFMFGGTETPEMVDCTDETLESYIEHDFQSLFGCKPNIISLHITRWPQALPLYNTALQEALRAAQGGWCAQKGRILFGNYTGQISLRGLCDSASQLGEI